MRRCCTLVSYIVYEHHFSNVKKRVSGKLYQLRVKLSEAGLARVVEDEDGVDHDWRVRSTDLDESSSSAGDQTDVHEL